MAANAGKLCAVKLSGTPTSMTAEATTGSGNTTYQITNTAKRVLDPTATITVKDGGVATVESYTLNRLTGTVTFGSAVVRTITIDGTYLPMTTVAEGKEFSLQIGITNSEDSAFLDADVTRLQNEADCKGSVGQWKNSSQNFKTALDAGTPVVLEFVRATSTVFARCWALFQSNGIQAEKKGLIEETIAFDGSADADGRSWTFLE
jgi:hypothetical protein